MSFYTDTDHPNAHDSPQGTAVYWSENQIDEQIEVLSWNSYSPSTGEYNATIARFAVDRENKILTLEHVNTKRKYSAWDETLTNPASFVTDRMKRSARKFIAQETSNTTRGFWRVSLHK